MIKKLIKLVIGMMAISWFAKKMHNHCGCHDEKHKETMSSKLKHYMDK